MKRKIFISLFAVITLLAIFLRVYGVTRFPPSPYWEEVALGYDAYSILKTGKDHHGHPWPVVAFESFGDWKPALYFYTIVPFIQLFGLTELAVRLPAIISGVLIVIGVGLLSRHIFSKNKHLWQLVSMVITAISPWAIQFSRAAWEVNLATALILWGVVIFLHALQKKNLFPYLLAIVLLVLSMYTYHSARVIAPLLGVWLAVVYIKKYWQKWQKLIVMGVFALILVFPILRELGSAQTSIRFAQTSIFSDINIIKRSNNYQELAGHTLLSRIFYHRYLLFGKEIIGHFLDHFHPNFLFVSGDANPRHSIQYMGTFYHIEIIFLLLGVYRLFEKRVAHRGLLLYWLIIGILPAALTKTTPHALRILPTLPVWLILITLGIKEAIQLSKQYKYIVSGLVAAAYIAELSLFWRFYSTVYPEIYKDEWQYGYQAEIQQLEQKRLENPDQTFYFSRKKGRPAMYYWFYTQTDPREVQAVNDTAKKDQGEFLEFKNIKFE